MYKLTFAFAVDAILLGLLGTAPSGRAQNQPSLQITSPANNAVVNPGQTISVNVTSPNDTVFTQVFVVADRPMNVTAMATSVPAQLSLTVPQKIALGKHS